MTKLVIVESNAKCKKIEKYLGNGYKCVASYGHLTHLPDGLKSLDLNNNYSPRYKIIQSKAKYIKILKDNIKKAEEVILATDDDREGEAIAWHICKLFGLSEKTTKRIKFNEITKKALLDAVSKPTIINMVFALILYGGVIVKKPLLKYLLGAALKLEEDGWRILTQRWIAFFVALAVLNEIVWRTQSTDVWVNFKVLVYCQLRLFLR